MVSVLLHPPPLPPFPPPTPSVLIDWYRHSEPSKHEVTRLADMRKLFVHTGSRASACSGVSLGHLVPHCLPHPPALPHPGPLSHHTLLLWPCCPQTTPARPCCCSGQSPLHDSCRRHNLICLHAFHFPFHFILYLTVWVVEPVVTHQTSWQESTGVCGVRQNQASGSSV